MILPVHITFSEMTMDAYTWHNQNYRYVLTNRKLMEI